MKLTYLKSSTCIIQSENTRLLLDPWLTNGEYYGSWNHLTIKDIKKKDLNNIDYIYVSHIHPDHLSKKTFNNLSKKIKILIHKFEKPFLKNLIKQLGFEVIEINHGENFYMSNNFFIKIYAADDCNPQICSKYFGCEIYKSSLGSNQIDTLAIISNGKKNILNVNDCPYDMSKNVLTKIKKEFKKIDLLLTGYSGAGPYPQCFENLNKKEKIKQAQKKRSQFLNQALSYVKKTNPLYIMPFAGTYFLCGKLAKLNNFRGVATRLEAKNFIKDNFKNSKPFILKTGGYIDLNNYKIISEELIEKDLLDKKKINMLKKNKLDYEKNKIPKNSELRGLLIKAFENFKNRLIMNNYKKNLKVTISLKKNSYFTIDTQKKVYSFDKKIKIRNNFLLLKLDIRLLYNILKGPKYAHWNNAEIGSHIVFNRKPDIYDRKLFYCLNFFHS
jgi:UDP-MurNAc hydroxylase